MGELIIFSFRTDLKDSNVGDMRYALTDEADDTYGIHGRVVLGGKIAGGQNRLTTTRRIATHWNVE